MRIRIVLLPFLLLIWSKSAIGAEWKYIGQSVSAGKTFYAFYDDQTKEQNARGFITVWIKLISTPIIDSAMEYYDSTLVEPAAKKVAAYYVPPFILARADTSSDAALTVIQLEVLANNANLPTGLLIRYQLDCRQRKLRIRSAIAYEPNGESRGSSSDIGPWEDIAPETFGEMMIKVVCATYN